MHTEPPRMLEQEPWVAHAALRPPAHSLATTVVDRSSLEDKPRPPREGGSEGCTDSSHRRSPPGTDFGWTLSRWSIGDCP